MNQNSLLDNITGGRPIGFQISIDMVSATYLALAAVAAGVVLIIISKKIIQ